MICGLLLFTIQTYIDNSCYLCYYINSTFSGNRLRKGLLMDTSVYVFLFLLGTFTLGAIVCSLHYARSYWHRDPVGSLAGIALAIVFVVVTAAVSLKIVETLSTPAAASTTNETAPPTSWGHP